MKDKLNLGCGMDIREGYINVDCAKLGGVDVVYDLTVLPLPFEPESFVEINCQDVLEHFEYMPLVVDLYRLLKPNGKLFIKVPHFTSKNNFIDPTHKKMFSYRTFEFFLQNSHFNRNYYFNFKGFSSMKTKITFEKKYLIYNHLIEPIINIHNLMKNIFESTFISRIFPAESILIEIIK